MNAANFTALVTNIQPMVMEGGLRVISATAIFVAGKWSAQVAKRLVKKLMTKARVDPTLTSFASNILFYGTMAFVVLAALGQMGIETTSLVAVLGAAGLAIGLALQGSLTNFAAGIIIIIFHPFGVDDWIEVDGYSGYVTDIHLLTTNLRTLDNRAVIVPNSTLTDDGLVNNSTLGKLRLDLVVGVDYSTDIDRVKQIFAEIVAEDARVLEEPTPIIGLLEMADSSLNFAVRPWVLSDDYFPARFAIQEAIKKRLDAEGISIPFPQRDVHVIAANERNRQALAGAQ